MSVIIRLQNLPWSANSFDIRQFFAGLSIPEGGVHIVGGELGDAFIAFSTDEDARQAMRLSGGKLKEVQVMLMLSSRNEMQKVIETARSVSFPAIATPAPAQPAPVPVQQVPHVATPPQQSLLGQLTSATSGIAQSGLATQRTDSEEDTRDSRKRSRSRSRDRSSNKRTSGRKDSRETSRRRRSRSRDRDRRRKKSRSRSRDRSGRDRYGRDAPRDGLKRSGSKDQDARNGDTGKKEKEVQLPAAEMGRSQAADSASKVPLGLLGNPPQAPYGEDRIAAAMRNTLPAYNIPLALTKPPDGIPGLGGASSSPNTGLGRIGRDNSPAQSGVKDLNSPFIPSNLSEILKQFTPLPQQLNETAWLNPQPGLNEAIAKLAANLPAALGGINPNILDDRNRSGGDAIHTRFLGRRQDSDSRPTEMSGAIGLPRDAPLSDNRGPFDGPPNNGFGRFSGPDRFMEAQIRPNLSNNPLLERGPAPFERPLLPNIPLGFNRNGPTLDRPGNEADDGPFGLRSRPGDIDRRDESGFPGGLQNMSGNNRVDPRGDRGQTRNDPRGDRRNVQEHNPWGVFPNDNRVDPRGINKGDLRDEINAPRDDIRGDFRRDVRRDPRGDIRGDTRSDFRGDVRGDPRGDFPGDSRGDPRGDLRGDQRGEPRGGFRNDYRVDHRGESRGERGDLRGDFRNDPRGNRPDFRNPPRNEDRDSRPRREMADEPQSGIDMQNAGLGTCIELKGLPYVPFNLIRRALADIGCVVEEVRFLETPNGKRAGVKLLNIGSKMKAVKSSGRLRVMDITVGVFHLDDEEFMTFIGGRQHRRFNDIDDGEDFKSSRFLPRDGIRHEQQRDGHYTSRHRDNDRDNNDGPSGRRDGQRDRRDVPTSDRTRDDPKRKNDSAPDERDKDASKESNNKSIENQSKPSEIVEDSKPKELIPDVKPGAVEGGSSLVSDCVFITNLPTGASDRDLCDFFSDIGLTPKKLHMMLNMNGEPSGEAYVEFWHAEQAEHACSKDGAPMGRVNISVKIVSRAVMLEAVGLDEENMPISEMSHSPINKKIMPLLSGLARPPMGPRMMPPRGMPPGPMGPRPFLPRFPGPHGPMMRMPHHERGPMPDPDCVVTMRNIPYRAGLLEIVDFFAPQFILSPEDIFRKMNERGLPTSEARAVLANPEDAMMAVKILNNKTIRDRHVFMGILGRDQGDTFDARDGYN